MMVCRWGGRARQKLLPSVTGPRQHIVFDINIYEAAGEDMRVNDPDRDCKRFRVNPSPNLSLSRLGAPHTRQL